MPTQIVNRITPSILPNDHPYMNAAWTPNYEEYNATGMEVIGEIPEDVDGAYFRNTENPVHEPIGRYHPFEGDGMIHMMHIAEGQAEYRNRFVRTKAFAAEQEVGHSLWAGLMEHPRRSLRPGWGAAFDFLPVRRRLPPGPLYAGAVRNRVLGAAGRHFSPHQPGRGHR